MYAWSEGSDQRCGLLARSVTDETLNDRHDFGLWTRQSRRTRLKMILGHGFPANFKLSGILSCQQTEQTRLLVSMKLRSPC